MEMEKLTRLAPVGVSSLIAFLAYGSQLFFPYIEPYGLETHQSIKFNIGVICIWISYARSCLLNPGRVPKEWEPPVIANNKKTEAFQRTRWCKKCGNFKPPRSHHCKTCQRCVPKMDHHCPWTINCVSHRTLPSFIRFLFYATASMAYLEYFYYERLAILWHNRKLPSYLGPTPTQLAALFVFSLANSLTLFLVGVIFVRTAWCVGANTTTIEGWEIDRHEVLVRRAKALGGYLDGPDGVRIRIRQQEFPYDIGIWSNIVQGMNGGPLTWLWPFAAAPSVESGLEFQVNGFEDPSASWPPPDPDRMTKRPDSGPAFTYGDSEESDSARIAAFRARQEADLARARGSPLPLRRRPYHAQNEDDDDGTDPESSGDEVRRTHEASWKNAEGERLADFGVDDEAEFYDEDDIPLSQLIAEKRNKAQQ